MQTEEKLAILAQIQDVVIAFNSASGRYTVSLPSCRVCDEDLNEQYEAMRQDPSHRVAVRNAAGRVSHYTGSNTLTALWQKANKEARADGTSLERAVDALFSMVTGQNAVVSREFREPSYDGWGGGDYYNTRYSRYNGVDGFDGATPSSKTPGRFDPE